MDLIYILHNEAGKERLIIRGDLHKYLIKVRRHVKDDELDFRSRDDIKILHKYKILNIDSRSLELELLFSKELICQSQKFLHIAWCVIDSKSIEKILPSLCEIGVGKISFISCDRSQKNFKLDFKRFYRILESSMQQCGRSTYIEFDTYKNIKDFITLFPDTKIFDLCENILSSDADFQRVLVGCEGGFSKNEREFVKNQDIFRLDTPMVLRSESAVLAVASKLLL